MTRILSRHGVAGLSLLAAAALAPGLAAAEIPGGPADLERDFRVIVEPGYALPTPGFRAAPAGGRWAVSADPPASEAAAMGTICGSHTIGAGWYDRPLELYLGEGAAEHIETIREAVSAWNRVTVRNLIELKEEGASYSLSGLRPDDAGADAFYGDGASVLYFSSLRTGTKYGYVLARQGTDDAGTTRLTEADVFIWSPTATTSDLDLLIALQHELGHALGLANTPISGNVMSNDYRPAIEADLDPFIYLGLLPGYDDSNLLPGEVNLFEDPQYELLLRTLVRPRAQDKTGIMCMYPFVHWGRI